MNEKFRQVVDSLHPKLDQLLAMAPSSATTLPPDVPVQGIYLFSERETHLYVGRSNSMKARLRNHWSGTHKQAAFAFKLAREKTGFLNPTYQQTGSRDDLMTRPQFVTAFGEERNRIGNMDLRYVEEVDELRQCLLEEYVSVALDTAYDRWDTT